MKTITAILAAISLMAANLTAHTRWLTVIEPINNDFGGQVVFQGKKVTEPVVVEASDAEVSMYLEYGLGWAETRLPGERHTSLHFHQNLIYVAPINPGKLEIAATGKRHRDYNLRICAISAPYWIRSFDSTTRRQSLNSRTPFSLQNAMRCLAEEAQRGKIECNWEDHYLLSESVLLVDDYEDNVGVLEERLQAIQPNVLFLGSMTLSFPGAIQIGKTAKRMFGDNVLVVLGGKHVNETFYMDGQIPTHHKASALKLMQEKKIDHVFDIVVSGDGEYVSMRIAEVVDRLVKGGLPPSSILTHMDEVESADGTWCLGWIDKSNEIKTVVSSRSMDRETLPIPAEVFGVDSCFPIFQTDYTAHVYSDSGRGCVRDCDFCSERRSVAGLMQQPSTGADRLFRQLCSVREIGEINNCSMSAFVEDSILLTGSPQQLARLADLMEKSGFHMKFGGQFTIPDLTNPRVQSEIIRLQKHGLCYIYAGMETINKKAAIALSKNRSKGTPWLDQNEKALAFIHETGLGFGVSVLFGLGESRTERMVHLEKLALWQEKYGKPQVVSLNWATEHPLFNKSEHDFVEWGTDGDDPRLGLMQQVFGEASARYCFKPLPDLGELRQIAEKFTTLNSRV